MTLGKESKDFGQRKWLWAEKAKILGKTNGDFGRICSFYFFFDIFFLSFFLSSSHSFFNLVLIIYMNLYMSLMICTDLHSMLLDSREGKRGKG